jgi:poly-gamma-glutamate synthase PgsB/CapB
LPGFLGYRSEEGAIRELLIIGGVLAIWLMGLYIERVYLQKTVDSIPLRICVTGTRGKSSVTRLIAASLRGSGMSVLARTTGAKPVLIFPDGSEKEIERQGPPTILEGKKILKAGARLHIDACVVELMAIQPETIYVESQKIFNPHILVITNVRLDHMAQMGRTKDRIASCLASAIPGKGTVFIPEEDIYPVFRRTSESKKAKLVSIPGDAYKSYTDKKSGILSSEFDENVRVALSVNDFLGQDTGATFKAMSETLPDYGSLKVWTALSRPARPDWYFVSGFAANEPESTRLLMSKLKDKRLLEERTVIGVLNLRGDRGDRTLQWFEALKRGGFPEIQKLICMGHHRVALIKKLKKHVGVELYSWRDYQPKEMMARLVAIAEEKAVVIGMGNMGGAGKRLVDYWEEEGVRYDL